MLGKISLVFCAITVSPNLVHRVLGTNDTKEPRNPYDLCFTPDTEYTTKWVRRVGLSEQTGSLGCFANEHPWQAGNHIYLDPKHPEGNLEIIAQCERNNLKLNTTALKKCPLELLPTIPDRREANKVEFWQNQKKVVFNKYNVEKSYGEDAPNMYTLWKGTVDKVDFVVGIVPKHPIVFCDTASMRRMYKGETNTPGKIRAGESVTYTCDAGHTIGGITDGAKQFKLTCTSAGEMQTLNETEQCQPVSCPITSLPKIPNAEVSLQEAKPYFYGDKATFTCSAGTKGQNLSVGCLENGTFETPIVADPCGKVKCDVPTVSKAQLSTPRTLYVYQDKAEFSCVEGHTVGGELMGAKTFELTCTANGVFSTQSGECAPISCSGAAPAVDNAKSLTSGPVIFESLMQYECNPGYTIDGVVGGSIMFGLSCEKDGQFQKIGAESPCKPVACSAVKTLENPPLRSTGKVVAYSGQCLR